MRRQTQAALLRMSATYAIVFIGCFFHRDALVGFFSQPLLDAMPDVALVRLYSDEIFLAIVGLVGWLAAFLSFPYMAAEFYFLIWSKARRVA